MRTKASSAWTSSDLSEVSLADVVFGTSDYAVYVWCIVESVTTLETELLFQPLRSTTRITVSKSAPTADQG